MNRMAPEPAPAPLALLRAERDRFVAFAFTWADLLFELEGDGRIVYAAGAVESLVGQRPADLIGRPLDELVAASQRPMLRELLSAAARGERIDDASVVLAGTAGSPALGMTGYRLPELNGHIFVGLRRRPTGRALGAASERGRDPDSGLLEVRAFIDNVCRLLADAVSGKGHSLSLIRFVGLERLQPQREAVAARDPMREFAACLQAYSAGGDLAARIGPDRLGLLHEADLDVKRVERELLDLARDIDPRARGVAVEWARFDMQVAAMGTEEIAKGMVYLLNRFRSSDEHPGAMDGLLPSFAELARQAKQAISRLREIVTRGEYGIVFQPILDAQTGVIHHYEALARFPSDTGLRSAGEHIMLAEEIGLVSELDIGIARKVVDWMRVGGRADDARVAVNVSGQSVTAAGYASELDGLLDANIALVGRLMFEITESSGIGDLPTANRFVLGLRARGCDVCLDDFGAGAANFQYLANLDVSIVKFDGGAVRSARATTKGLAFLKSLIGLCRELQIGTVIEMVDTEASLQFAWACGADFVQGYLFGKPHNDPASFAKSVPSHLFRPLQSL